MVCSGSAEGFPGKGDSDAHALWSASCCCCESDIWCVIVVMLVIDCSSRCWNGEKDADELEEVAAARI